MKAVIRSDKGVFVIALLSESYDEAVMECVGLQEDGIIKADEEVISIIE
ncbi:MAG: hypothetical protein J6N54_05080 [Bacteroidales bacterium]|nr:hypothetical protein [Bacteroidales bacterium]